VVAGGPYLGADEALAMGLVTEIARPRGEVTPLPGPGYRSPR